MHTAAEIGIDDFQASARRTSATARRRCAGLFTQHEGRLLPRRPVRDPAATWSTTTTGVLELNLSEQAKRDLVEYLKSPDPGLPVSSGRSSGNSQRAT